MYVQASLYKPGSGQVAIEAQSQLRIGKGDIGMNLKHLQHFYRCLNENMKGIG